MNIAIIQARMSSTRLPGKMMLPINNKPTIAWVIDSAQQITGIDKVIVATSDENSDDILADFCKQKNVECFRGNLQNVLKRYYDVAKKYKASNIIRITGDCPFIDPDICAGVLYMLQESGYDYVSNSVNPTFPNGMDCEAFTIATLEQVYQRAKEGIFTEHVTTYVNYNRTFFNIGHYNSPLPGLAKQNWTLDTKEDYELIKKIASHLKRNAPPRYIEILNILKKNPEFLEINKNNKRNEVLEKHIKLNPKNPSFTLSNNFLEKAERVIPLGSQTFSKSKISYSKGYAPLFATHGSGGRIWDIDGNMYIDLINGLMPNVLGYADPDIDWAIKQQLNNGITLSLATELETKLAEKLVNIIPCAEKVRFAKNGSDATSGCIRLARAYTGKNRIIMCGYHGWQDWYISTTSRDKGIPKSVSELSHAVPYNDLEAVEKLLRQYKGEFAAMIIEPMNSHEPKKNYLQNLKKLLHKHNILLIFDEVITGFRFSLGGAQEFFGVTPDLASFGKSMGNGMPISAIVGSNEVMREMEDIFFSGTFGGETLSLAASLAVIDKMEKEPVIEKLWEIGKFLRHQLQIIITKYNLDEVIQLLGNDVWTMLSFKNHQESSMHAIRSFVLHEMHKQRVLTLGSHNLCYAHNTNELEHVINVYDYSLNKLANNLKKGDIEQNMLIPVIKPIFSVRKL